MESIPSSSNSAEFVRLSGAFSHHLQIQRGLLDLAEVLKSKARINLRLSHYYNKDIILHNLEIAERRCEESSRKIMRQKSLLEVLESERMILLHENGRLGYKVSVLVEENRDLACEFVYVKRMVGELARCMIKMREDRRAFMLSRMIEDLQRQVRVLEKRNKEYHEQLAGRDEKATIQRIGDAGCLFPTGKSKQEIRTRPEATQVVGKAWNGHFMCGIQTDIR